MSIAGKSPTSDLKIFWHRIRAFLRPQRRLYVAGGVFEFLTLGTVVLYPQLIRTIVDDGLASGSMARINWLVLLMASVLVVQGIATYLRTYIFELASQRVTASLRQWVFGNLLIQEMGFFDDESTGDMTARLNLDTSKIGMMMKELIPDLLHFGLMGTIAGALMIYTSPLLSLAVVLVGPAIWFGTARLGGYIRRQSGRVQDRSAGLVTTSLAALAGIQTVRTFDAEQMEAARYAEKTDEWKDAVRFQAKIHSILRSLTNFFSEAAILIAVWAGGALIVGGSLTTGAVVTFILYATMVTRSVQNVSHAAAELLRAEGATQHVFELGERQPRIPITGGVIPDEGADGVVALDDVHFAYPTRPDTAALRGVSLEVAPGEALAIVGSSGSGKSTIAKLMARLYDPDKGRVRLDDTDLREIDAGWLRRRISYVPSEATLFPRSVADNIRFGREEASDREVEEAARVACAHDFIEALDDGYETDVGDQGRLFSSGQRQRIAIARAVLMEPQVLILDEATAALDSESETLIKESLRKLPGHPSIVIVSHRLSTILDADRVILVREGRISAVGKHSELLASSSDYRELLEDQLNHDERDSAGAVEAT